jgi:hypothetical protein
MPYTAEISRSNPTCFVFLVDQSGSMAERWGSQSNKTKAEGVADAINRLLQTLVFRCAKGEYILDRYYVGAIGYGAKIQQGFPGVLAGQVLCAVSDIANTPLRIEERVKRTDDGAGGLLEQRIKFPVWFEPAAAGKTPMCQAFQLAQKVVLDFVTQHPACFPPIVINITDGAATDGDPQPCAAAICGVASQDGNALLFNVHVSASGLPPVLFPTEENGLPDDFARRLFRISSRVPPEMLRQAQVLENSVADGARGFAFNADLASVIMFLDIGTRGNTTAG